MAGTSHRTGFFMTFVENVSQNFVLRFAPGIGTLSEFILAPRNDSRAGSRVKEYNRAPRTARKAPMPIEGM